MITSNGIVVTAEMIADVLEDQFSWLCDQMISTEVWLEEARELITRLEAK